jgi:hypothetical protein
MKITFDLLPRAKGALGGTGGLTVHSDFGARTISNAESLFTCE